MKNGDQIYSAILLNMKYINCLKLLLKEMLLVSKTFFFAGLETRM